MDRHSYSRASRIAVGAVCMAAALGVEAGPSQSSVASPGGFVTACASPSGSGSGFWAGSDLTTLFPAGTCLSNSFSGSGAASADKSYTGTLPGGPVANQATGSVALGQIHMAATNDAPNSSSFASADANGGWTEKQMKTSTPALNGQPGVLVADIKVTGTLEAQGFAGSTGFQVAAYKDGALIRGNIPGFDDGTQSDGVGQPWYQNAQWSVATYGGSENYAFKTVNDTVLFAVPIIFGQAFDLGIYAYAHAGMRSASAVPGNSTATLGFSHTLSWAGVAGVYDGNNNLVLSYTLTGASGKDWTIAAIPEPETWAMLLAGLALVGSISRRRRAI